MSRTPQVKRRRIRKGVPAPEHCAVAALTGEQTPHDADEGGELEDGSPQQAGPTRFWETRAGVVLWFALCTLFLAVIFFA